MSDKADELSRRLRAAADRPSMPGRASGSVLVHGDLLRLAANELDRRAAIQPTAPIVGYVLKTGHGTGFSETLPDVEYSSREAAVLRRLLAWRVSGGLLYADDGELQDNTAWPHIDFKRDTVDAIESKLGERTRAALAASAEQSAREMWDFNNPTPSPFDTGCPECNGRQLREAMHAKAEQANSAEAPYRVAEFWSSSAPGKKVRMLAEGDDIEQWDKRGDFIRWVDAPARVPIYMVRGKRGGWVDADLTVYDNAAEWNRRILYDAPEVAQPNPPEDP